MSPLLTMRRIARVELALRRIGRAESAAPSCPIPCSAAGTPPAFFVRGGRVSHFFGVKFVQKVSPLLQLVTY